MPYALKTPRLHLRPFTLKDAPFMLELLNDPEFVRNVIDRGIRTVTDAERYLEERPLASYSAHGFGLLAVLDRRSDEPLGMCGLLQREHLDAPDLGFSLLPAARGRGIAAEAGRAVIDHARESLHLTRILGITSFKNAASRATLERLGFSAAGTTRMPGSDEDLALFSLEP